MDNGASFDAPRVSGGVQVSDEKNIFDFSLCAKEKFKNQKKWKKCKLNVKSVFNNIFFKSQQLLFRIRLGKVKK